MKKLLPNIKQWGEWIFKKYPLFNGCANCPDRHIDWCKQSAYFPEPDFPVDIVFTWVDDTDPAFVNKRAEYLPPREQQRQDAQGDSLYRNNDELRFSLRSIENYAPWVHNIFILTYNQTPAWLCTDNPKVHIVDHKECIPQEYLPTFSSRVIEAHLHYIPKLAEHFIYFNDDFFLLSPCTKADFFTANGLPYLFVDWRQSRRQGYYNNLNPHTSSFFNVRNKLKAREITPVPNVITAHMPHPLTKTTMQQAYDFFKEDIESFGHNKFRTLHDMAFPPHAVPLLSYANKQNVPRDMPFYYINAKRFDRQAHYRAMLREKNFGTLPPFLCLNDVGEAPVTDTWQQEMHDFLQAFYTKPSAFECE